MLNWRISQLPNIKQWRVSAVAVSLPSARGGDVAQPDDPGSFAGTEPLTCHAVAIFLRKETP